MFFTRRFLEGGDLWLTATDRSAGGLSLAICATGWGRLKPYTTFTLQPPSQLFKQPVYYVVIAC